MSDTDIIEGQATELEPVAAPVAPSTLFRTDDPAQVLARAQQTADALMPVVRAKGLISSIQGRDHLRVEAWTTLGAMLGVTPVCEWTRKLDNGWEARVEARTLDGRTIGAAEAECLRSESTWSSRDDYAIRSMAQTRATSKALASVLRFVATLAGVEGTPAEEMPTDGSQRPRSTATKPASEKQIGYLASLVRKAGVKEPELHTVEAWVSASASAQQASEVIEVLKDGAPNGYVDVLVSKAQKWEQSQADIPADAEGLPS